jgi:hypothetical protein
VFFVDVLYVANGYIVSVCSKCFIRFRRMMQLFHLSVAKVDVDVGVEKTQALSGRAAARAVTREGWLLWFPGVT